MDTPTLISAGSVIIGALLGGGGLTAWVRARSQNRTEARDTLTQAEASFRTSLSSEIAALRQQVIDLDKSNDSLLIKLGDQTGQLGELRGENKSLTARVADLEARNREVTQQSAELGAKLAAVDSERAQVVQRLFVAESTVRFLTEENTKLRDENTQLRASLPVPILNPT